MKKLVLTALTVLSLGALFSVHADGGLQVVRVDDDNTKVGANFDNGAGLELFGLNVGLYGDSKQGCSKKKCEKMQNEMNQGVTNKRMQHLKKQMQKCNCPVMSTKSKKSKSSNYINHSNYSNDSN